MGRFEIHVGGKIESDDSLIVEDEKERITFRFLFCAMDAIN